MNEWACYEYDLYDMVKHDVLVGLYEKIAHIVIPIDLHIDIWKCVTFICYVKGLLTYKYKHTHMYDNKVNGGA